jgi:hypothetical protein
MEVFVMPNNINDLFEDVPDITDVYSNEFLNSDLSEYANAFKQNNK